MDRLFKDLVTEEAAPDIPQFILLLQERVYVLNAQCRQFLISWILVLNSVPNIQLLQYLPKFLDGIFNMLRDPTKDIRISAESCLAEFLKELKTGDPLAPDYAAFIKILTTHTQSKDEVTRLRALEWILEFLKFGKIHLVPFNVELISAILPNISSQIEDIKNLSTLANTELSSLIKSTQSQFQVEPLLKTVMQQFPYGLATKVAALNWLILLLDKVPDEVDKHFDKVFLPLLKLISDDSSEDVMQKSHIDFLDIA